MAQRICSIDSCERKHLARGWCAAHYTRWSKYGDPLADQEVAFTGRGLALEERLLRQREISPSGCWAWTGPVNQQSYSYGVMHVGKRLSLVHRIAHELWIGPIPDGYEVDHVADRGCISTLCFNPAHLEAVTPQINTLRSTSFSAINSQKTHCVNGHPLDEANTYIRKREEGGRWCRACGRERSRRYRRLKGDTGT